MAPPASLVRTARCLWHWQWQQLMGGLAPADADGNYRRPQGAFNELPPLPANAAEPSGHVLIVGRSCPWAHRAWLMWTLRQLAGSIDLLVVDPDPAAGRWRFVEPFEGCQTLLELYRRCGAPPEQRATVPALYSRRQGQILVSESARLIELLNSWPTGPDAREADASGADVSGEAAHGTGAGLGLNLEPAGQAAATQRWRERLQQHVNDGVYRCGFARTQAAYDRAETALFETLQAVDASLEQAEGGWLSGAELSLADVVLFPTLIRLELVYAPLFGCSRLPLWELPALWQWRSRFYGLQGVEATCYPEAWRRDYFGALFPLHPSGIVPAGPPLATLVTRRPMS
jgi:putative glutathione S-transferase